MRSVVSASAGYYDDKDGKFRKLSLISRQVMRLSIVYSQPDKQLSVTFFPANISALKPLLSLRKDLSPYLLEEEMYLGFTASTGSVGAIHYMMGWFVNGEIEFPRLEFGMLPILPPYPKKSSNRTKTILAVCLTVSVIAVFIPSWIGFVFYLRHKKAKEVLEECEIQYGPHRFAYKELFDATKGFKDKQLLGRGGFGQVYKGALPGSDAEIAVKRTSHDSREGMSEFLAEISTIGRLRHPNLVRLLGYCRHKEDLYLVYDFMPNGSLDKEEQEVLVDWILDLWQKGEDILVAVEESIPMSAVMRILSGVSELPDNLLDVVRDENLRGWPEKPMELLFDVNSLGFSDLDLDMQVFSDLENFWDDLHVFNQMVLIFHSFKGRSINFRYLGRLTVSRLKYNALDDFQEVFQTTSRKSSRRLPGSLPDDFQEVFQTTSRKSSRRLPGSLPDDFQEVFFHIKWSPCLSL
ncbi:hypothetical protein Bca4012_031209 [Brassica carinata]